MNSRTLLFFLKNTINSALTPTCSNHPMRVNHLWMCICTSMAIDAVFQEDRMKENAFAGAAGKIILHLAPFALASGAALMHVPVSAGLLNPVDRDFLMRQASDAGGLMSVMVTVQDLEPDVVQARGSASIRSETAQHTHAIRSILGQDVSEVGSWNNGMGQVGLLITRRGLELLEQSGMAKSIQPDDTRGLRDRAWMSSETQRNIERELGKKGSVDVVLSVNSDMDYHIGEHGDTVYQANSFSHGAGGMAQDVFKNSKFGAGMQILESSKAGSGPSAVVQARIDWPAYYALRMAPEVRSMKVLGVEDESHWPEEVMDTAFDQGEAQVIITMRGGESYSPYQGYMSEKAWKVQSQANQDSFRSAMQGVGHGGDGDVQAHAGLGVFTVRLGAEQLKALYEKRDARIRSVELVKPVATPSLNNSTYQINMGPAWSAGFRGAGQLMIVFDTGVAKNHMMFKNAAGASRISNEACFGTNASGYKSICPSQNMSGDSAVGTPNSGMPYCNSSSSACSHGTHVAGIAAGRQSYYTGFGNQGVSPDASIVAVQIFSYPVSGSGSPSAFNDDLLAGLAEVYAATTPGIMNPYIVNMSLGSNQLYGGTCDYYYGSFALAVANLTSRGVPVVAATGNSGSTSGISFPACISKVIKASAVNNDAFGMARAGYANIAHPGNFDGPIFLAPGGNGFSDSVESASAAGPTSMVRMSGTSMAAPHVAGFYAAIKGGDAYASVADVTAFIATKGSVAAPQALPSGTYGFRRIRSPL